MLPTTTTTTTEEKSSSSTSTLTTSRSYNLSLNLIEPGPATLDVIDETTSLLVGGGGGDEEEEEQNPLLDTSQVEVGCKNKSSKSSAPKTTMALKR